MKQFKEILNAIASNIEDKRLTDIIKQLKPMYKSSKDSLCKQIDNILNDVHSPESGLIGLLTLSYPHYNLSDTQRERLKLLKKIIQSLSVPLCKHEHFEIYALMHGGGFSPVIRVPELYCPECGLNVSLHFIYNQNPKPEEYGLRVTKKTIDYLKGFCSTRSYIGVENILYDIDRVEKDAPRFTPNIYSGRDVSKLMLIVDKNKLENLCGKD